MSEDFKYYWKAVRPKRSPPSPKPTEKTFKFDPTIPEDSTKYQVSMEGQETPSPLAHQGRISDSALLELFADPIAPEPQLGLTENHQRTLNTPGNRYPVEPLDRYLDRRVQETLHEMTSRGIGIEQEVVDRLRADLLMWIEEPTRSDSNPEIPRPNPTLNPHEEALRMQVQVNENYIWYQSQGISISRVTLEWIYRRNGGLRMDFSQDRAEEERVRREAALSSTAVCQPLIDIDPAEPTPNQLVISNLEIGSWR
jgi:hypothetical protein